MLRTIIHKDFNFTEHVNKPFESFFPKLLPYFEMKMDSASIGSFVLETCLQS